VAERDGWIVEVYPAAPDARAGGKAAMGAALGGLMGLVVPGVGVGLAPAAGAAAASLALRRATKSSALGGTAGAAAANALTAFLGESARGSTTALRRSSGQRFGPKPDPRWRGLSERAAEIQEARRRSGRPPLSLRALGMELEAQAVRPLSGDKWAPNAVKRALEFGPSESRRLLRRIGPLLAVVQAADGGRVSNSELEDLGTHFGIHPHWFSNLTADTNSEPPLRRMGRAWEITDFGEHLVDLWRSTEERDEALQKAAWDFFREDEIISADRAAQVVGSQDTLDRLADEGLVRQRDDGRFEMTPGGHDWADDWSKVAHPDPHARFDRDFWPDPAPAEAWDWQDDPRALRRARLSR
jgi:hypothetical protein